jgi:putative polyhydroxyalkanoate system protein
MAAVGGRARLSGIISTAFTKTRSRCMAAIEIRRKHGQSLEDAKAAVERVAKSVAREYGFSHRWDGNTLAFSRAGAKGTIKVLKTEVHIHAELGFLMAALKGVIEGEIVRKLEREFGGDA